MASVADSTSTSHGVIASGSGSRPARELTLTLRTTAQAPDRVIVNETSSVRRTNGTLGTLDDLQPGVTIRATGYVAAPYGMTIAARSMSILRTASTPRPAVSP